jgi:hypothetical protein
MAKRMTDRPKGEKWPTPKAAPASEEITSLILGADEDEQLVANAGRALLGFFKSMAGFFTTAKALEQTSLQLLDTSKELEIPATPQEDEEIQRFIRRCSAQKRDVEEHWAITALISKFHRTMTARRSRSTDACTQAGERGNSLHFSFVQAERRRAQQENDRREAAARAQAEADRQAELARLEAEAVAREEGSAQLSGREQVFVEQMVAHGNGVRAAQAAGFPDPAKSSARLLKQAKVTDAIQGAREAAAIRQQAAARARRPVEVQPYQEVQPALTRAPGASERVTYGAELVSEEALVTAILAGTHGIPTDLLRIDPVKLNTYARDLKERINLWPGVRLKKNEKVI